MLRTPALEQEDAAWFANRGFTETQSLVILQRECRPDAANDDLVDAYTWRRLRIRRHAGVRQSVLALDAIAFAPPWNLSDDAFARACGATSEHVILVRRAGDGSVQGFAVVGRSATNAYLQRLAVRPEERRQGVATCLVRQASAWAESRGADSLLVNTEPTNAPALALYLGLGFSLLSHRLSVLERPEPVPQ